MPLIIVFCRVEHTTQIGVGHGEPDKETRTTLQSVKLLYI